MILLTATIADFIYRRSSYRDLRRRLVHDPQVQQRVRSLRGIAYPAPTNKSNGRRRHDYDPDLAEAITDNEITQVVEYDGWTVKAPSWLDLLPMRMLSWPKAIAVTAFWALRWFVLFTVLRRAYGDDEKHFLTRYNLGLSSTQWDRLPEHRKQGYLSQKLWDAAVYQTWKRKQRNRGGSSYNDDAFVE